MAARRPTTGTQRPYEGSAEQIAGAPPADDQLWTHAEANDHTDTLEDHADLIDSLGAQAAFSELIGNDIDTSFTLVYGLGREPEDVTVIEQGLSKEPVGVKVNWTTTQVTVGPFAAAPSVNQYRVIAE